MLANGGHLKGNVSSPVTSGFVFMLNYFPGILSSAYELTLQAPVGQIVTVVVLLQPFSRRRTFADTEAAINNNLHLQL